jgi:hypothetical protein
VDIMTAADHACDHWSNGGRCGNPETRRYINGWRCAAHTPAALAGRPDLEPDPELTLAALQAKAARRDNRIRICRDYTERLDLQRLPELNGATRAQAALFYARAGIPVHPLRPGTKLPATKNGVKDASTDTRTVQNFWRDNPDHNIGLATGHKFDVLDVDTKDGRSAQTRSLGSAWQG